MTSNKIFTLMAENVTADSDSDKALDNALKLVSYIKKHSDDLAAGYVRDFISAYINKSYADMMTVISNFASYLASESKIVEEIN